MKITKPSNPKLTQFRYNNKTVYGLELNHKTVQGYIKWRQKLFTEAHINNQTVGHPNGYHHRAVMALTWIIDNYGFDFVINDLNLRLIEMVNSSNTLNKLYVFEEFTMKYKSDLDEMGYEIVKENIPVASSGFPLSLNIIQNPEHDIAYVLIENESDNMEFDNLVNSNPIPADYYKITNFATKDIVSCLLQVEQLSQKYTSVKLWFKTIDMDGKYSTLFQKMLLSDVLPANVTIEPNEENTKFTEILNQK